MNHLRFLINSSLILVGIVTNVFSSKTANAEVITANSGKIKAEISYQQQEYKYQDVTLKISRSNQVILNEKITDNEYDRPMASFNSSNTKQYFKIQDVDGDKEPEIIVELYTGGAHCCIYSLIYRYNAAQNKYSKINHQWGNHYYKLQDLDRNGLQEFVTIDDRFAYAFASYAGSAYPIQIWQYRQGKMINVTKKYRQEIAKNAQELWQRYQKEKTEFGAGKAPLAAYLAAKYLLGEGQDGWQKVRQAYQSSDRAEFFTNLQDFLQKTGYTR